jgi:hypothetical protein
MLKTKELRSEESGATHTPYVFVRVANKGVTCYAIWKSAQEFDSRGLENRHFLQKCEGRRKSAQAQQRKIVKAEVRSESSFQKVNEGAKLRTAQVYAVLIIPESTAQSRKKGVRGQRIPDSVFHRWNPAKRVE